METGNVVYGNNQTGGAIIVGGVEQQFGNADDAGQRGVAGNNVNTVNVGSSVQTEDTGNTIPTGEAGGTVNGGTVIIGGMSHPQPDYVPQMTAEEAEALNEAQGSYVEELKKLVETLSKVNEQSARLTRDSEEMENLNRTLTGISKVYEMQLKGASQQIGTIDQINEQSRRMAQQIEQLNQIYARMIDAMTANMSK